ncbi:meiosis-specific topoisomerase Spo11 [Sordaria brevicollis]|uniref:DNA topoisomerase (ATP-hydrolyzing) n=1 Tax=Sordaria brevicollis TaxID=83679 RepID=A0AAE0PNY1_SORBR|nr:meiosis-specific topoisomerase Spo11 [Sordaria brevicollis]
MYFCPIRNRFLHPASQPTTSIAREQPPPPVRQLSSATVVRRREPRNIVTIPQNQSANEALKRIEALLETIVDAISVGGPIVIPYRRSTNAQTLNQDASVENSRDGRYMDSVRFPGRNPQELRRFEALFRIIEISHEALLSGTLITKRNIYYQNMELFKSQSVVDEMVDNLAFTLGLGRSDLNIVATAKGLIAGQMKLIMRGGTIINCTGSSDSGVLLPSINAVEKVNFQSVKWLLVIEKDATFRTLSASRYYDVSRAGKGILVTGKGYPDLATRKFLAAIHAARPRLPMWALVDFDPHGISILRTYQYGSQRLNHEENTKLPRLRWLGIRSADVILQTISTPDRSANNQQSQPSQDLSSQESIALSVNVSQDERPAKRPRTRRMRSHQSDCTAPLTEADREKAISLLQDICTTARPDNMAKEHKLELQKMLMLNVKAEIQAVDDFGDITNWLDERVLSQSRHQIPPD